MSSIYRGICLNHVPAIEFPEDSTHESLGDLIEVWQNGMRSDVAPHRSCDVVFGQYSYPLIEVICPPTLAHDHVRPVGIDVEVLRGILNDLHGPRGPLRRSALRWARDNRCWSLVRLRALERLIIGSEPR